MKITINQSKDPENHLGELLFSEGNHFLNINQPEKALEKYFKNLEILDESEKDLYRKGKIYGNIGNAYTILDEFDKAIIYFQKSLDIAKQLGDLEDFGLRLGNLGSVYLHKGRRNFEEAERLLERSYNLIKTTTNTLSFARKAMNLGSLNFMLGRLDLGKAYLNTSINKFEKLNHPQAEQASHLLAVYQGKASPPPKLLHPDILSILSQEALFGDKVSEAKVLPTLKAYSENPKEFGEVSLYSKRLLMIFDGERNYEVLKKGLPKELAHNLYSILRIIENPDLLELSNKLGDLVVGIIRRNVSVIESVNNLINFIRTGISSNSFYTIELADCLEKLINGEGNIELIVEDLNDEFQIMIIRNAFMLANEEFDDEITNSVVE